MSAAVIVAVLTSLVISAVMLIFGKAILSLFISGTPEEVAETLRVAYYYLSLMSICLPVLYVLHVTRSAIQGMGNTVMPMVSGIAELAVRMVCAVVMPMLLGDMGILYSEVLAWVGAVCVLIPSYLVCIKKLQNKIQQNS